MAKKNGTSAFDDILESIGTPEDREALLGIADRYPILKESVLRQADYSRNLNELRGEVEYANQWKAWEQENWDPEHEMTRAEYLKQQELDRLKAERDDLERKMLFGVLDTGDDSVDQAAFESKLAELENKFQSRLAAKEKEFIQYVQDRSNLNATAFAELPRLSVAHLQEFGEVLDSKPLLAEAVAKGNYDLGAVYEQQIASRRQQRQQAEWEKKLADKEAEYKAAIEAKDREANERIELLKGMGQGSPTPSDSSPSELGAFQRQYLGLGVSNDGVNRNGIPDKAKLGDGTIAAIAARNDFEKAAGRA